MRAITRHLPYVMGGLLLGVLLTLGQRVSADKSDGLGLPLEDLRTFTEIYAKIKNDYVEVVDDKSLIQNAIRGMLAGLDPHSAYLVPEDYQDLQAGTSGEFGGLGIEVGMEDGFVKVIAPIDDTPAQRAGVQSGDLVVRLDETPVKGMTLADAVKIMRGKPGTDITLTIVREGEEKPLKIVVTRDVIKVTSVKSKDYDGGFAYVRVTQFQSRTGENLRDAVSAFKQKNGGKLNGLVLDLRNNPGGVLSAAVSVSDAFLTSGLIVYTEGRLDDAKLSFSAKPTDIVDGAPIVVLVNGGSASASEIVAGALQDHRRAIIMGQKTFGKGSVQTILPMENGSALKLTTARYFTPNGTSIQAQGIIPDVVIDQIRVAAVDDANAGRVKEADLARHLTGEAETSPESASADEDKTRAEARKNLARDDYELYEALNLLRGLALFRAASS